MSWMVESRCATAIVRAAGHQDPERVADEQLGLRIDARGRLVQDEDARVEGQRPREREQLLLADGQVGAALAHRAPVPSGSRSMNRAACTASAARFTASSLIPSSPSRMLLAMVPEKSWTSWRTRLKRPRRSSSAHLADVHAVHEDPPARHVVEPHQQVDQRGLARPGRADHAHALARLHLERHVAQDELLAVVGEPDVVEGDRDRLLAPALPALASRARSGRHSRPTPASSMARPPRRLISSPACPAARRSAPTRPSPPAAG